MVVIGNIISDEGITSVPDNFKILTVDEYLKSGSNLPTIIIGWENTKNNFTQASILKKKIKDNLYWTFSPIEKRTIFEEDLKKFIKKSYDDFVKDVKHSNIDPIIYKINTYEEFIKKLDNIQGGFAYLYLSKVVYIFHNSTIFSIDLDQLEFIGFNREIILSTLKKRTKFLEENAEKDFKNELKYIDIKYLPYLHSVYATTKSTTTSLIS